MKTKADPDPDAGEPAATAAEDAGSAQEIFDDFIGAAGGALRDAGKTIKSAFDDAGGWWKRNFDAGADAGESSTSEDTAATDDEKPKKGGKKKKKR